MSKLLRKLQKGNKGKKQGRKSEKAKWIDFDEDDYENEEDYEEEYEDEEDYEDEYEVEEDSYEEYEPDGYEEEYEDEEDYEEEEYEDEEDYEDGYEVEEDSYEEYEPDGYEEEYEDEEDYEEEEYEDEEDYEDGYEVEEDSYEEYEPDGYEEEYEDEEDYEEEEYEDEEDYEDGYEVEEDYESEQYEEDVYDDEEDEEDYETGYDEENEEAEDKGIRKVIDKITNMSLSDHIVTLTGAAVLILAVVTGSIYFIARSNKMQLETFAEIGAGVEDISVIGESGLIAVADAQAAKLMAAGIEEDENEWDESEKGQEQGENGQTSGKTEVGLNLTSIQKDLKIKFVNKKSGKLIPSIAFEVEIEKPSGGTYTMKDEDKDGIIYQTNIEPGKYKIKITSPVSDNEYTISSEAVAITVKDTIEYKKVEIADEVKTESQVNVAVEDTKVNETVVESTNKDTVEWVESTKTLIEGTGSTVEEYEKVDRSKIADPEQKADAGFRLLAAPDTTLRTVDETGNDNDKTIDEEGEGGGGDSQPEAPAEPTKEPDPTEEPEPTAVPTKEPEPTAEPTNEPTALPTLAPTQTPEATAPPTATPEATATPTAAATATATSKATATPTAAVSPTKTPAATPTATPSSSPTATPGGARTDTKSVLKTTSGETLYIKTADGKYVEAKYADYYNSNIKEFFRKVTQTKGEYKYTGWQEIDGATFYFDKNGNKVTGEQVIQGAKYNFNSDGSLNTGSGHMGIDVSRYNGNIDWNAVKNSGVSYVIIRCGYRGSATGALVEDSAFRKNIQGASSAGLKVGVYFFTQAVNEVEAVEEASMVLSLIKGYNLTYPVFLDVEATNGNNGRADRISVDTRTAVCNAFCQTIQNSGYKAGIYANKTWFTTHINTPSLTGYKIWLAQYAAAPSYNRTRYDMWQYSSKGKVAGISGNVDMNISYMGY